MKKIVVASLSIMMVVLAVSCDPGMKAVEDFPRKWDGQREFVKGMIGETEIYGYTSQTVYENGKYMIKLDMVKDTYEHKYSSEGEEHSLIWEKTADGTETPMSIDGEPVDTDDEKSQFDEKRAAFESGRGEIVSTYALKSISRPDEPGAVFEMRGDDVAVDYSLMLTSIIDIRISCGADGSIVKVFLDKEELNEKNLSLISSDVEEILDIIQQVLL